MPTYESKHPKVVGARQRFALLIGTTSLPLSLSENDDFKALISFIDPKLELPGRKPVTSDVMNLFSRGKQILKKALASSPYKIGVTADIWSKKGFSASYMGVTTHFITREGYTSFLFLFFNCNLAIFHRINNYMFTCLQ